MAEHLLHLGASPTTLLRALSIERLMATEWKQASSDMLSLYFGNGSGVSEWKLDGLMDTTLFTQRHAVYSDGLQITPDRMKSLKEIGADFIHQDSTGRSLMHCVICSATSTSIALRNYGLERTTPFPWHLDWISLVDMAFLTSKFALLRRALSFETFHRILNLEPERGWSPLCWAAALDRVDIIQNCLSMKAAIDFEGAPLGSALVVASACGSLRAVKCLVQHGAAISYTGSGGFTCALTKTRSVAVRAWLLVGRFTERLCIGEMEFWSRIGNGDMELRPWSGIIQARVAVVGKLGRRLDESSLDHLKRLGGWKKLKLGQVITVSEGLVYPIPRISLLAI